MKITLHAPKPLPDGYPKEVKSIGDRIRKRRIDLGLEQKDVAKMVGANVNTITNWELNYSKPPIRFMPQIIDFLGYYPFNMNADTLGEKIKEWRVKNGISIQRFMTIIKMDRQTIVKLENDEQVLDKTSRKAQIFLAL